MPLASPALVGDGAATLSFEERGTDEKICEYYRKYFHEIYAFVYRYSRNKEEAEDFSHDIFAKALEYLRRTNEEIINPRAWLYRIAKTHCIDRISRKKRIAATELKPEAIVVENPNGSFEEAILDRAMIDSVLQWVAANSSETEQQIFELKIIRGLSQAEIGEIMECHASTISRILNGMIEQIVRRFV